jgi:hypothetical protein
VPISHSGADVGDGGILDGWMIRLDCLSSLAGADDGVGHAAAAHGGANVVNAHEVGTLGDRQREGGEGAFEPLREGQPQRAADEPLARGAHEVGQAH